MALSDQPSSIAYITNGVTTAFAFPFAFAQQGDLVATFKDVAGVVTLLILNGDYTIAGVVDPKLSTYSAGATLNFGVPPVTGGTLRITRRTPRSQVAVYQPDDGFPAGAHEAALDRAMMVLQDWLSAFNVIGVSDGPTGPADNQSILINANMVPGGTLGWVYLANAAVPGWYEFANVSGS